MGHPGRPPHGGDIALADRLVHGEMDVGKSAAQFR